MKVNGLNIQDMEKESMSLLTVAFMKVNGLKKRDMEKERKSLLTEEVTMVTGLKMNNMGKERMNMLVDQGSRESKKMELDFTVSTSGRKIQQLTKDILILMVKYLRGKK